MASGPSAGVILMSSTQKPAGIGAGDVSRMFNRFRDNHALRFALKCGNRIVSDAILGGDAYSRGASTPPRYRYGDEFRGLGYLYGDSDANPDGPHLPSPTVRTRSGSSKPRTCCANRPRTLDRHGRAWRGRGPGTMADVLRNVQGVFYAGEAWVSWPQFAQRLADQIPSTTATPRRTRSAPGPRARRRREEGPRPVRRRSVGAGRSLEHVRVRPVVAKFEEMH